LPACTNRHLLSVDLTEADDPLMVVREVQRQLRQARRHAILPTDVVWRAMGQFPVPRTGQVAYHHISLEPPDGLDPALDLRPIADSSHRMSLQFVSSVSGRDMRLTAMFPDNAWDNDTVSRIIADCLDSLHVIVAGASASAGGGGEWILGASPQECLLCRRRQARSDPDCEHLGQYLLAEGPGVDLQPCAAVSGDVRHADTPWS
jgi:hypothetical protein